MDLKALETKWRVALSSILDELTGDEFRKLLFNLEKIPQGLKEGRPRGDMPSVIIQHYGTEGSITLMDRLMKILPRLDAAVQQPLRGIKDELKKLLQKKKAAMSKPADLGAVPKEKEPAAAAMSKPADLVVPKKKPAAAAMSKPADLGVVPKKKPAAEVSGASSETQSLIDSTRKLTLNPQAPQDQSAAPVQMKEIQVIRFIERNKTNTHLQVQIEGGFHKVYGTTQVLSDGMGYNTVEEFNNDFSPTLPLVVMVNMQGKKILEMRMI